MGWRQPAEGLVFSGKRPNSPPSNQPLRPHVPRTIAARSSRRTRWRLNSRIVRRAASTCPRTLAFSGPGPVGKLSSLRAAISLEPGPRPLRRESPLKEPVDGGRGRQIGNVPSGQVILDGGEVLFPFLDA